jgi:hypothetical protein
MSFPQEKEAGLDEVEQQKWQSTRVDERDIPAEQKKAEARIR